MDIAFLMGMVLGFLLGIGFCMFFSDMLAHRVLKVLGGSKKPKEEEEAFDDDPVNFWKPKGWKPDN